MSFNLCIKLFGEGRLHEYYDSDLNVLCHFKYPKLFIRRSKACYITFIQPQLLKEICNSQPVSYASIRKRLERNNIKMRFNELRDIFGTTLVNNGILEIEQDLVCGRIPVSIFIRHYWSLWSQFSNVTFFVLSASMTVCRWMCSYRTCEAVRRQLGLDFLVAVGRRAIVETIEPVWNQFFCPDNWAVCWPGCSTVRTFPAAIVHTIEPASDALWL